MVTAESGETTQNERPRYAMIAVLAWASGLVATLFNLVIPLIPVLPHELDTSASNVSWVATAFFLAGAVANPVAGRLADMYGNRLMFLACTWLLILGSVVCALAPSLTVLLAGRVLQGLSLPLMSISLSIMRQTMPIRRLPLAVGAASAAMGVGNGIGLVGGGFLIDTFSWHAVFWATVVVTLPVAVLTPFVVPADRAAERVPLDWLGSAGLVMILVCLLLPLSKMAEWGASWQSLSLLAAAVLGIPWWARGRLRSTSPVVDLRSLRSRAITATHVLAMSAGFCGFMCFIVTTHTLQVPRPDGFGMSLTEAGLFMTPASLSFLVVGPMTSLMILRLSMRRTLVIGEAVTALGALTMVVAGAQLPALMAGSFIVFIGNGILLSSLPVATAAYSAPSEIGSTNGVNALARTTGLAFASGVFALVVGLLAATDVGGVLGWSQLIAATIAVCVGVLALVMIPRRPAPPPIDTRIVAPPPGQ